MRGASHWLRGSVGERVGIVAAGGAELLWAAPRQATAPPHSVWPTMTTVNRREPGGREERNGLE